LRAAKYVAIVHDAEPAPSRDAGRAEALIALAQALNAVTRCALSTLRAGGNRSGADVVLTWQTGFPMSVDFSRGFPRYRPDDGAAALLERGEIDAALVVGDPGSLPAPVGGALRRTRCAAVGPRASEGGAFAIAIDTGVAGIHEGGTAFRTDDVPLPLRASLPTPRDTASVVRSLGARVRRLAGERRVREPLERERRA
jgi:formylmethanofuran dehydrogenase subunit B